MGHEGATASLNFTICYQVAGVEHGNPSESGGITPSAPGQAGMRRWEAMGGYAAVLHTVPVRRPQLPNKANALVMLGRQQELQNVHNSGF